MSAASKKIVQEYVNREISYHEQVCGNGRDVAMIEKAFKAGWRASVKQNSQKLDYVHKLGLRFCMMQTSDEPEPHLAHTWELSSDHERMFREWSDSIGWEKALAAAEVREDRLRNLFIHAAVMAEAYFDPGPIPAPIPTVADAEMADIIRACAAEKTIRAEKTAKAERSRNEPNTNQEHV